MNCTVVMNKIEYENKMTAHLQEGPYSKLSKNPTEVYRKSVQKYCESLHKVDKIDDNCYKSLTCNNSRTPIIYGAPKLHKDGIPIRPINSSFTNSEIEQVLHGNLKPIVCNNALFVRNSEDSVRKLRKSSTKKGEILISYDAKNLFTSIPINRLPHFTLEKLQNDPTVHKRTKLSINDINIGMEICLRSTFFSISRSILRTK